MQHHIRCYVILWYYSIGDLDEVHKLNRLFSRE